MMLGRPWITAVVVLVAASSWSAGQTAPKPPDERREARNQDPTTRPAEVADTPALSVVLGRPTNRSITVSVLSAAESEARVEYGDRPGAYTEKTEPRILQAGTPSEFEIRPLKPNTSYHYRLLSRPADVRDFRPATEGTFHTQRAPGSTFTFAVQGDSHPERLGNMYNPLLYAQTLRHVTQDAPDFYFTMGDDFSIERLIDRAMLSPSAVDQVYARQRSFLGVVGRSSALFLVNGNHEQAALCNLDGTQENAAVLAGRARTRFFPLPAPDSFYGGDAEEVRNLGLLRDYYSWTWGDALYVVIDPYWHSPSAVDNEPGSRGRDRGEKRRGGKPRDLWDVTLGDAQYRWLTQTLTESKARWKFVFCHHVLGTGRGGIECAPLFEWGGKNRQGEEGFTQHRPGWGLPIHQLMVKTGVTIFFQGHDHLFARQELDGVVYQSCPNPADPTYQTFNREAYRSGDILPNSGHLRVTVAPDKVRVEYVRSYLPKDVTSQHPDGEIACAYEVAARAPEPNTASSQPAPPVPPSAFVLRSSAVADGGPLPPEFTGDGEAATLPLEWTGAPEGTRSFAVIMHHVPPDGPAKWYWVLYDLPVTTRQLPRNVRGLGTLGTNSINGETGYAPPHSKGPGPKTYIYTVYALSSPPPLPVPSSDVSRDVLLGVMKDHFLGSAELRVVYARSGSDGQNPRAESEPGSRQPRNPDQPDTDEQRPPAPRASGPPRARPDAERAYPLVATGQERCFDNNREIPCPSPEQPFHGQDAQHQGNRPAYRDNNDGTITDLNTGLMWIKARGSKVTWDAAVSGASACRVGGHSDWRVPTIKQLYSLIDFNGGFHPEGGSIPYLDVRYFDFVYGDETQGARPIDGQDWSATPYVGTTMNGNATVFGVNFADGRIKGYPKSRPGPGGGTAHTLYVRYVRGNPNYGTNDFHDNGDGTITDRATGLMWAKADSQAGLNWEAALAWVQARNAAKYCGHTDWRLPDAKELQSIVDYTRAPQATDPACRAPAIDPVFEISKLDDGEAPFFWTSTTHLDGPRDRQGGAAVYIAFGRALGWMQFPRGDGEYRLLDVHGAGAQRSDPKRGDPAAYPHGRGPQGDVIRILNYVRCVRGPVP